MTLFIFFLPNDTVQGVSDGRTLKQPQFPNTPPSHL